MTAPSIQAPAKSGGFPRWLAPGSTSGALIALVVLVLLNVFFTPNFATASNFWNVLLQASEVVLVAVGMTLVIATGGIDLSVGSVMAIAGSVAAVQMGLGMAAAIAIALVASLLVGVLNGALITRMYQQSEAYNVGLRPGDVIVSFNGQPVDDPSQFARFVADAKIGSTATVRAIRDGRNLTFTLPIISASAQPRRRR